MKEALLYIPQGERSVRCFLCNHACCIKPRQTGRCRVRENRDGILYSLNYGKVVAANVDPIEKKPLYHFLPGSKAYSIACGGCNFRCDYCQNWQISQVDEGIRGVAMTPHDVVSEAKRQKCQSISYTYTEPTIYFEFALECAKEAKEQGLRNSIVTNGFMSQQALACLSPVTDAANVDVKSFSEEFYQTRCGASLKPVLDNIRWMKEHNIWVEVTTLIIPGYNDDLGQLTQLASFLVECDSDIPWHLSAYHPDYRFNDAAVTPLDSLLAAYAVGQRAGLHHVYIGNVATDIGVHTVCPGCKKDVIKRMGFFLEEKHIAGDACTFCGTALAGIF